MEIEIQSRRRGSPPSGVIGVYIGGRGNSIAPKRQETTAGLGRPDHLHVRRFRCNSAYSQPLLRVPGFRPPTQ
jgi:hypothetical protein